MLAGPDAGRSRMDQILLSGSIDEAINQMTQQGLDPLNGRRVYVRVGDLEKQGTTDDYVRVSLEHRLTSLGVVPVETLEEADAVLLLRVRVAGTDRTSYPSSLGDLIRPILYNHTKAWAAAELDAQAIDRRTQAIMPLSRPSGYAVSTYSEMTFLLGIIGPFKSLSMDSPVF
jgi:hypothetical protein